LFLSGVSFKIRFLRSHLVENRPEACRNFFFNYQAVVSWNYFVTEPAKRIFTLLLRPICFLPNDTSRLKILHGYAEGKYWAIPFNIRTPPVEDWPFPLTPKEFN